MPLDIKMSTFMVICCVDFHMYPSGYPCWLFASGQKLVSCDSHGIIYYPQQKCLPYIYVYTWIIIWLGHIKYCIWVYPYKTVRRFAFGLHGWYVKRAWRKCHSSNSKLNIVLYFVNLRKLVPVSLSTYNTEDGFLPWVTWYTMWRMIYTYL